jgi:hypothetical protein
VLKQAPITDTTIARARSELEGQLNDTQRMLTLAGQLVYSGSSMNR